MKRRGTMDNAAIHAVDLVKEFGKTRVVDRVSIDVGGGAILGLVGPNGAGKTTVFNMLTGMSRPTSGTVAILGKKYDSAQMEIRMGMGVMPEKGGLYEQMSGEEFLSLMGYMFEVEKSELKDRINELLHYFDLASARRRPIHQFSRGMKKKLGLAAVLLYDPQVVMLDEPFENLDPLAARKVQKMLARMAERGATVFLTSHILSAVEALCSEVAVMIHGRIVFLSPTDELRSRVKDDLTREVYESLEDVFVSLVESDRRGAEEFSGRQARGETLSWLS